MEDSMALDRPRDGDIFQKTSPLCGDLECRFSFRAHRAFQRMPPHRQEQVLAARDAIARDILLRAIRLALSGNPGIGTRDTAWLSGQFPEMHYHGSVWLRITISRLPVSLLINDVGFVVHA